MKSRKTTREEVLRALECVPAINAVIIMFFFWPVLFVISIENVCRYEAGAEMLFGLTWDQWGVVSSTLIIVSIAIVYLVYAIYEAVARSFCNHSDETHGPIVEAFLWGIAVVISFPRWLVILALRVNSTIAKKIRKLGRFLAKKIVIKLKRNTVVVISRTAVEK